MTKVQRQHHPPPGRICPWHGNVSSNTAIVKAIFLPFKKCLWMIKPQPPAILVAAARERRMTRSLNASKIGPWRNGPSAPCNMQRRLPGKTHPEATVISNGTCWPLQIRHSHACPPHVSIHKLLQAMTTTITTFHSCPVSVLRPHSINTSNGIYLLCLHKRARAMPPILVATKWYGSTSRPCRLFST